MIHFYLCVLFLQIGSSSPSLDFNVPNASDNRNSTNNPGFHPPRLEETQIDSTQTWTVSRPVVTLNDLPTSLNVTAVPTPGEVSVTEAVPTPITNGSITDELLPGTTRPTTTILNLTESSETVQPIGVAESTQQSINLIDRILKLVAFPQKPNTHKQQSTLDNAATAINVRKSAIHMQVSDLPDTKSTSSATFRIEPTTGVSSDEPPVTNVPKPDLFTAPNLVDNHVTKQHVKPSSKCFEIPIIERCFMKQSTYDYPIRKRLTWYYDPVEMTCQFTSDCIQNANAFETKENCQDVCMPTRDTRRCLAPPKAGFYHCSGANPSGMTDPIWMVYFDKSSGKCRWFTYYGCGGTSNRFNSIDECEETCTNTVASTIFHVAADLCHVAPTIGHLSHWTQAVNNSSPPEKKPSENHVELSSSKIDPIQLRFVEPGCSNRGQFESRWYFDPPSRTCKEFAYSHCGGSVNNFLVQRDCEQFCGAIKPNASAMCSQSPDGGKCSGKRSSWYFDMEYILHFADHTEKGTCRTFNYTGCGGNSNRFTDEKSCENACGHFRIIVESPTNNQQNKTINVSNSDTEPLEGQEKSTFLPVKLNGTIEHKMKPVNKVILPIDLEPCRRSPNVGHCRPLNCSYNDGSNATDCRKYLSFQRWFFNIRTSNCEPFHFTGCQASENTFDDAQSCQIACKSRIVRPDRDRRCDSLPHQTKCYSLSLHGSNGLESNSAPQIAFHFSVESATCKAFHLDHTRPDCSLTMFFANGHECLRACVKSTPTEEHLQNRCFARKTHSFGNCTDNFHKIFRWSYLPEVNQCIQFAQCSSTEIDTDQPGNNFESRAICETTCMAESFEDVCQLPVDPGPCSATNSRYYYDIGTSKCRMFLYGGCLGNVNRFLSRHECEQACKLFTSRFLSQNMSTGGYDQTNNTASQLHPTPITVEVFDQMRRITQHHTDHFPWDPCLENHFYGTCSLRENYHHNPKQSSVQTASSNQLTRYFYDRRLGKCEPFTYTGCGAKVNHFDTVNDCERVCEKRLRNPTSARCQQTNGSILCKNTGIYGWAFNQSIGDCSLVELCSAALTFDPNYAQSVIERARLRRTSQWFGPSAPEKQTTSLPTGIYVTRSACQYHCLPRPPRGTDAQNVCHMNPIVTVPFGCHAMVTRWYFEPREGTCRRYITCPQYGNNFASEKFCHDVCSPKHPLEVCRLPLDHGGCSEFATRWYYDFSSRTCRPFLYGGCFGNSNRFLTLHECELFCSVRDICRLPLQKNSSDSTYPSRYYYDQATGKCHLFYFSGILAHGNNFPSLNECNRTCVYVPNTYVINGPLRDGEMKLVKPEVDPFSNNSLVRPGMLEKPEHHESSPCASILTESRYNELVKQKLCEFGDIVHELAYRYRPPSDAAQSHFSVGVCELTLVPICLSETRQTAPGTIVDGRKRTIGRVFRTKSECEKVCFPMRRVRRNAYDYARQIESTDSEALVEYFTAVRNGLGRFGCENEGSLFDILTDLRWQNVYIFTQWPCIVNDTIEMRQQETPLYEQMSGQSMELACWVVSTNQPYVRWTRLADGASYKVLSIRLTNSHNVWTAYLRIDSLHPENHNGAWACQLEGAHGQMHLESLARVHVIEPMQISVTPFEFHSMQNILVPEGGTLVLNCPLHSRRPIYWYRMASSVGYESNIHLESLENLQTLLIRNISTDSLYTNIWVCKQNRQTHTFKVSVAIAPKLTGPQITSYLQNKRPHHLTCDGATVGNPAAQVIWFRCSSKRHPFCLSYKNYDQPYLNIRPKNVYQFACRLQNMWGRVDRYFESPPKSFISPI